MLRLETRSAHEFSGFVKVFVKILSEQKEYPREVNPVAGSIMFPGCTSIHLSTCEHDISWRKYGQIW